MAKLTLTRTMPMSPERAWAHASDLSSFGDWLSMHQGWRGDLPAELGVGVTVTGVAGVKGMRNRVSWTIREYEPPRLLAISGEGVGGTRYALRLEVDPIDDGCRFTVTLDLGGRPLFGLIGATAARLVRGDLERSIARFETLYA